jgi:hypothetical protein
VAGDAAEAGFELRSCLWSISFLIESEAKLQIVVSAFSSREPESTSLETLSYEKAGSDPGLLL